VVHPLDSELGKHNLRVVYALRDEVMEEYDLVVGLTPQAKEEVTGGEEGSAAGKTASAKSVVDVQAKPINP
tara:strand:+ start:116 stop:328 length:213 start_codon:yes stop_codon:yes gene_type:complete